MSAIRLRAKRTDWRACSSTCSGVMRNFLDRKSTRLNSSHLVISYAVFCLKKKTKGHDNTAERKKTQRTARPQRPPESTTVVTVILRYIPKLPTTSKYATHGLICVSTLALM